MDAGHHTCLLEVIDLNRNLEVSTVDEGDAIAVTSRLRRLVIT